MQSTECYRKKLILIYTEVQIPYRKLILYETETVSLDYNMRIMRSLDLILMECKYWVPNSYWLNWVRNMNDHWLISLCIWPCVSARRHVYTAVIMVVLWTQSCCSHSEIWLVGDNCKHYRIIQSLRPATIETTMWWSHDNNTPDIVNIAPMLY